MISSLLLAFTLITRGALADSCLPLSKDVNHSVHSCGNLKIVRLSGNPIQRANTMGKLLRGPLSADVVQYFTEKVSALAKQEVGAFGGLATLAYNQIVRLFHRATPPSIVEEVDAMAQGMGIDPIVLRRGLSLPDTASLLQGLGSHPLLSFLPALGCSSVAAPTKEGGIVYGRNLDFAGVNIFDRHPMLLAIDPPQGSLELRHLVIGSDGLLFGGITGVNEAGIVFAIHQNFSRDVGIYGVPMIFIGELVLRSARNLNEAEAIIRENRPASLWTFVLNDLNTGESLAVEASQKVFLSRRSRGKIFAQTNHAMHEESRISENADFTVLDNSELRMKRAVELLENLSPADVAKVLSYQENPEGQLSAYADILKGETIQTAIFEATPGKAKMLYLSVDEAPTAGGKYAAIAFEKFWGENEIPEASIVDLARTPPEKRQRQLEIANAYQIYFDQRRPLAAADTLEKHQTLDAALFRALAFYQVASFQNAIQIADKALLNPRFISEPKHIRQSMEVIRLNSFLQLGRLDEARNLAQKLLVEGPVKKPLMNLCEIILRGRKPPAWMLALNFSFFSGDLNGRND